MKVLFVCSSRAREEGYYTLEQAESLRLKGLNVEMFFMKGTGFIGYLFSWFPYIMKIFAFKPEIIHAHYGLSGFVAVMQPFRPVVLTVHGGDIFEKRNSLITQTACLMARRIIIVNEEMRNKIRRKKGVSLIPCAVDLSLFMPGDMTQSREMLGYDRGKPLILFSSKFSRKVKNYGLAKEAVSLSESKPELLELANVRRDKMPMMLNSADAVLVTSYYEGSPQIVKEAMAMNVPVVSTDVGDIRVNFGMVEGCYITGHDAAEIALAIDRAVLFRRRHLFTAGRERIVELGLDPEAVTSEIINLYSGILRPIKKEN